MGIKTYKVASSFGSRTKHGELGSDSKSFTVSPLSCDRMSNKYFELKQSLNVKKVFKLVEGSHEQIDLITGLNSGGYTEIIKGEVEEGDDIISKVIIETSEKKALRLF